MYNRGRLYDCPYPCVNGSYKARGKSKSLVEKYSKMFCLYKFWTLTLANLYSLNAIQQVHLQVLAHSQTPKNFEA